MPDKDDPAELIARIYDGAHDPVLWPHVLEEILIGFDAICFHLFIGDLARDEIFFASLNSRFSLERLKEYHDHYRHVDDRLLISLRKAPGRVYTDSELIASDDFKKSEFYNDFYAPHGLRWSLVGMPIREDGLAVGVSIHRPPRAEAFTRGDLERAQFLFPHFARAARLMRRTAGVGPLVAASAAALDRLPMGLFVLDPRGRPLFHNRMARRLIDQADGLGLSRHGLHAGLTQETNRLRRAIASTAAPGASGDMSAGGVLRISRPSGKQAYQVIVTPLRHDHHPDFPVRQEAGVLVVVSDPDAEPRLPEDALARLFGFTAAESALAIRLMRGQSLKEVAEATNRSLNTVRWTLKNLLAKADCRRQVDLVRLLHSAALAHIFAATSPTESDE